MVPNNEFQEFDIHKSWREDLFFVVENAGENEKKNYEWLIIVLIYTVTGWVQLLTFKNAPLVLI